MARKIFEEIGNDFDTTLLLKLLEKKPELIEIIQPVIELWKENYQLEKNNSR